MEIDSLGLQLCDIQGRLFERAGKFGYSSPEFICAFMNSAVAKGLDSSYNRYQWAGEEYLLEELSDGANLPQDGVIYSQEVLYWAGYIYRYWHLTRKIGSSEIVKLAPPETMNHNYTMFHTMDPVLAIDDLIEIYNQRSASSGNMPTTTQNQ